MTGHVAVVSMGGTIAMAPSVSGGIVPSLGADDLVAAVRVATAPAARGLGALVVMSDEVHGARFVRKSHTSSTAAFVSPGFGPIGVVVEGDPRIRGAARTGLTVPTSSGVAELRVALVTVALGDDGELLKRAGDAFDGMVIAGLGAGHVPARMVPAVAEHAARIPVVLSSRTGSGSVLRQTYGYPGSERDLLERGLIHSGFLDPAKARVLLQLLLASGATGPEIAAAFDRYR